MLLSRQPEQGFRTGPNRRQEQRNHAPENAEPLPALDNAMAVRDTVARLITDVYAGKLHPRVAAGLAPLMNLQLAAIETTNLEQRIEKLEKLLAKAENKLNDNRGIPGSDVGHLCKPPAKAAEGL